MGIVKGRNASPLNVSERVARADICERKNPARWVGVTCGLLVVLGSIGCNKGLPAVSSIAIHPTNSQIIYVGTARHIHKSRDGGATWNMADEGMSSARVMSLAVDPRSTAMIYAGTFGDAIWRSWNGGQTWIPDNRGLKGHLSIVTAIVFDQQVPAMMYLGSTVGIFKRTDPEEMWMERVEGMESVYTVALVADPKHPDILYAGTSGGIYKSVDRAEHWKVMNAGLSVDPVRGALSHGVNSIVVHPVETNTLYIGTTRGFFTSTDGARQWSQIRTIPAGNVASIVIHPRDPSVLYAGANGGIYKSTDGGAQWTAVNHGLTNLTVRVLAMDPQQPETLYAGTNGGLFESSDGGRSWTMKPLVE